MEKDGWPYLLWWSQNLCLESLATKKKRFPRCIQVIKPPPFPVPNFSTSNHLPEFWSWKSQWKKKNVNLQFKSCHNLVTNTKLIHNPRTCNIFYRIRKGLSLILPLPAMLLKETSAVIIFLLLKHGTLCESI